MDRKKIASLLLTAALLAGTAGTAVGASLPAKTAAQYGVAVSSSTKAVVDYSNLAEGYLMVRYTGGKNVRIKVQITKAGSTLNYNYDLNNTGANETFPLTEGDGQYTVKVLENTTEDRYAAAHTCTLDLKLRDSMAPYLYANQFVNFNDQSQVVAKAAELMAGKTALEKVTAAFNYVVDNFTDDYDRAASVQSGYLPNVDSVLAAKKGICFDYAAVMTAMLRSQGVPCKLVVGYAGTTYHAWINVYTPETGWIEGAIYFDGKTWTLMDPTFTSTGKRSDSIMKYVTNSANYQQKYAY